MEKTLPQNIREIIGALGEGLITQDQALDAIVECITDSIVHVLNGTSPYSE